MKKSSTYLFVLALFVFLVFLVSINFFKDTSYLSFLGDTTIILISGFLIILTLLFFFYREVENNKTQNEFITIVTHKFRTPLTVFVGQ